MDSTRLGERRRVDYQRLMFFRDKLDINLYLERAGEATALPVSKQSSDTLIFFNWTDNDVRLNRRRGSPCKFETKLNLP
jgi:hypothetical protein